MPELIRFQVKTKCVNIAKEIGTQWWFVGTDLLDDKMGTVIPTIAQQHMNNASLISMEILSRWVQEQGIADTTWRGLLGVLKVHCPALAESIVEALLIEDAADLESGK